MASRCEAGRIFGLARSIPSGLEGLVDLALDLRWSWSHAADALWEQVDHRTWERTGNPWTVLQYAPAERLERLASEPTFRSDLKRALSERKRYLQEPGHFTQVHAQAGIRCVAFFSMEFGLGRALPLYAGGLGVLAGDYLKAASDLGVPAVGVGLLYQEGYFRQVIDANGEQLEFYPFNDPASLPIQPVVGASGAWLHVPLELPGRTALLRVWRANVGRVVLYLLDSNDPLNCPADRGITGKLYGGGAEMRLLQELALGIGGWRALEMLGHEVDVCHLNEGHTAFAILERARGFMRRFRVGFREALCATRAGNVFTTHTPVSAGFDNFPQDLVRKYFAHYLPHLELSRDELCSIGCSSSNGSFRPAQLAMRGCSHVNAVSRIHGQVSRGLFAHLYPRWPLEEIPIGHVTNGVHVPSWDSEWADRVWTRNCGKNRWLGGVDQLADAIRSVSNEELWAMLSRQRIRLVQFTRHRVARQLSQHGVGMRAAERARHVLDPEVLTLGFARRFAEYKRPNLLLHDEERLARLIVDSARPIQLIVAGKAHPDDFAGKALLEAWGRFVRRPDVRHRAVFLEDYELGLAQELVQGVDVWLNLPRRPWEACGTSGMKVLVNGGLNLSERDGWWEEAYGPEVGWVLPDTPGGDAAEAEGLFRLLEDEVIPLFYERAPDGIPHEWLKRVRTSMARLAPQFSANRMVKEYVKDVYLPAVHRFRRRSRDEAALAKELCAWQAGLEAGWHEIWFGELRAGRNERHTRFEVEVLLGEVDPECVRVELCANAVAGESPVRELMARGQPLLSSTNGFVYRLSIATDRPPAHFTPRIVPYHPQAFAPLECRLITWATGDVDRPQWRSDNQWLEVRGAQYAQHPVRDVGQRG